MKKELLVLCFIIFAVYGAGSAFAEKGSLSGQATSLVNNSADVRNYLGDLSYEQKLELLGRINLKLGLNLTLADLESKAVRKAVMDELLREMTINRQTLMEKRQGIKSTRSGLREDVVRLFLSNISLYAHNLTAEEKMVNIAEINSKTGLNITAEDLTNASIRPEVRQQIDEELRNQLEALKEDIKELREGQRRIQSMVELARIGREFDVGGRNLTVREINNKTLELTVGKMRARFGLNLSAEENVENATELKARLSNGRDATVKIMPDRASFVALSRLRAKCLAENCSVELKEVGNGNNTKVAYEFNTQKESKLLFLFKKKMAVQAKVDASTGQIMDIKKPWWSFLAKEENALDEEISQEVGFFDTDSD